MTSLLSHVISDMFVDIIKVFIL